ncbi:MAG: hypothetical protein ACPLQS_02375 [Desulfurococcaceae archaeon]
MSSSLKPCPDDKTAYLKYSGDSSTLYICLVEDKRHIREELEKAINEEIKQSGLNRDLIGIGPGEIVEKVAGFLVELRNAIDKSISEIYGERGFRDISVPRVDEDKVNPGEFAGNFLVYSSGRSDIVLHVEPKIGWDGYIKMLRETRQSIDLFARETGVLEPLLGNFYYPSLSSPISYSILLLRLTELILSSTPPKKTVKLEVLSEGVVGRPIVARTIKYILQGNPFGVYERIRIEPHDYPYMLLARFHHELSSRLGEVLETLREALEKEEFYGLIAEKLGILQGLHVHYLTTPPLHQAFNILIRENIPDHELIQEARKASRVNLYFGLLADLYEMYLSDIGLIHEYVEKGAIVPSASSKIYELWVLTRIVGFLEEKHGTMPSVDKYKDLYLVLKSKNVRLMYNMPQYGFFTRKLKDSKLLYAPYRIRPDFIVEAEKESIKETVVYDAKYKVKLSMSDLVKLLAYIAEFSTPVVENSEKLLTGAFYKLCMKPSCVVEYHSPIVKNHALPMKVVIHLYALDPRMPDDWVNAVVEQSLCPLI